MIKYVGFDKDGTLFDTIGDYSKVWGEIFNRDYGLDAKSAGEFLAQTAGQSTRIQVLNLLKNNGIYVSEDEAFDISNKIAEELGQKVVAKVFPDVSEALSNLKKEGYGIFVSSGQQEDVVRKNLEDENIFEYIDFYAGVQSNNPDYVKGEAHFKAAAKSFGVLFENFVKETVFVGDTQTDVDVSRELNIPCIIRQSGNIKVLGAKFYINDFLDLPNLISSI